MIFISSKLTRYLKSGPSLNLFAGYFCFASTAAYGLLSLPLAVSFLDKEHLGLWNLVTQVVGYLLWLDLGVATMTGRTLAEPVAKGDPIEINRTWSAILAVLTGQALLIIIVGLSLLSFFLGFFRIPEHLREDATFVFLGAVVLNALALPVRAMPGVLLCQDRLHLSMIIQGILPWVNLLAFWILLESGLGIRAFVFSTAVVNICQFIWYQRLLKDSSHPLKFRMDLVSRKSIRPILGFSSSMMLWGIAPAAIASIPALVIARNLTLDHVSIYNVTSRIPVMLASIALRTYHSFYPRLQKLFVSGERQKFALLYRFSTLLSIWVTGILLFLGAAINPLMVAFLARPDFFGGNLLTILLAVGLIHIAVAEHLGTLFYCAGKPKLVSLVLALEVAITFVLAVILCKQFGLIGVAAALAFTPAVIRIPYFMAFGPKTCGFRLFELYASSINGVASILLMGSGICLLILARITVTSISASVACLVIGGVIGFFSLKSGWRDFIKLKHGEK